MTNKGLILLVEDDERLNLSNQRAMTLRGFEVITALTLKEAREWFSEKEPDIILLDVVLPDGSGMDFCAEIRELTTAHILFLTSKLEHEDMMRGLMSGGDDYITKPFHPKELLARIDSVMRRRQMDKIPAQPLQTITKGSLVLDILASRAFIGVEDLQLTPKEFSVLLLLVQNEDKVLSAEYVYEKAWNLPLAGDKNSLKITISRLRPKVETAEYTIQALRGQGYVFQKQ